MMKASSTRTQPTRISGSMNLDTSSKASNNGGASVISFMKELDRLQEQQLTCVKKIEHEKKRNDDLDIEIEVTKRQLKEFQTRTKNGEINKVNEHVHRKKIIKLEKQLQKSKISLSISKTNNIAYRKTIEEMRRDKKMNVEILYHMENELHECKQSISTANRETALINDKKNRVKLALSNVKHTMIKDMEDFSTEISSAKVTMSLAQASILETIREKIKFSFHTAASMTSNKSTRKSEKFGDLNNALNGTGNGFQAADAPVYDVGKVGEIQALVNDIGFTSVKDLLGKVYTAEESLFAYYNEVQERNAEMEKMESENKKLEANLEEKIAELSELEGHNDKVRLDLEQHITSIQKSIAKYDRDYALHMEVLNSIAENLLNLLKYIASDEAALDQQLLSTGITDRNIDDFLGIIEQRIDDLIQISKAAMRQALKKDDFVKIATSDRVGLLQVSNLPSLQDLAGRDDDDDDNNDENVRVQPVSIALLKENMTKKMQRNIAKAAVTAAQPSNNLLNNNLLNNNILPGMGPGGAGVGVAVSSSNIYAPISSMAVINNAKARNASNASSVVSASQTSPMNMNHISFRK